MPNCPNAQNSLHTFKYFFHHQPLSKTNSLAHMAQLIEAASEAIQIFINYSGASWFVATCFYSTPSYCLFMHTHKLLAPEPLPPFCGLMWMYSHHNGGSELKRDIGRAFWGRIQPFSLHTDTHTSGRLCQVHVCVSVIGDGVGPQQQRKYSCERDSRASEREREDERGAAVGDLLWAA